MDVEYRYDTTGHNNGQIGSMKDWVSGTTNRITSSGFSYNANGTMATMPNWQGTYDKESRLVDVTQSRNGTESYEYDGAGRRIWTSNETMMFYGVDGKRLAKCQIQEVSYPAYGYTFACTGITYFLGQVVTGEGESGGWGPWGAARDRLGSVRAAPYGYYYHDQGVNASSYFPYGQARTGGSVWATYQPSSVSGTMYAMNREYSAAYGRFLTPDPSAGVSLGNPGSWNRYAYTQGDPVNYTDQQGLRLEPANDLGYEDPAGRSMLDAPYVLGGPGGGGYRTYGPLMAGTIYTTIPGASWDGVAGEGGTPLPGAPFNFDRGPAGLGGGPTGVSRPLQNGGLMPGAQAVGRSALSSTDCAGFFGLGSDSAVAIFNAMTSGSRYGGFSFRVKYENQPPSWGGAETGPGIIRRRFTITINSTTNHSSSAYLWNDGNDIMNAYLLLHELGHVARFMGYKGGGFEHNDDGAVVDPNKSDISEKCLNGKI